MERPTQMKHWGKHVLTDGRGANLPTLCNVSIGAAGPSAQACLGEGMVSTERAGLQMKQNFHNMWRLWWKGREGKWRVQARPSFLCFLEQGPLQGDMSRSPIGQQR